MIIKLTITIAVDEARLAQYMAEYPGFIGETPGETLGREAVAAWDFDGFLLNDFVPIIDGTVEAT